MKALYILALVGSVVFTSCGGNENQGVQITPRMNLQAQIGEAEVLFEKKMESEEISDDAYVNMVTMYKTYITTYGDDSLSFAYALKASKYADMMGHPEDVVSFADLVINTDSITPLMGRLDIERTKAKYKLDKDCQSFHNKLDEIAIIYERFGIAGDVERAREVCAP